MTLVPGTVVHRYRLEAVVGAGGMGTVFRATQLETGEQVAVKTLHPHMAMKREHQKRFLREARAAMATQHPNIVRIIEVFEHEGAPMIAMELLTGESLEKLIVRETRLPLDRTARILVRVTSAVGTAHALGIVHRDLKPDNIFISNGDEGAIKVLDFGIAKLTATTGDAAETAALTRTGALMGTPFYMSPQQAFGEKKIDQRSDIWSLGIILYQCLSGVLPTSGKAFGDVFRQVVAGTFTPIAELCPGLPPEIAELVGRMLQREPDARPWDLREVHTVLERYAQVSAPAFGIAVAPLFDELTADTTNPGAGGSVVGSAPRPNASPLALTPSSLHLGAGVAKGGVTPNGTIAMNEPMQAQAMRADAHAATMMDPSAAGLTASGATVTPPMTSRLPLALAVLALAVAALVAVFVLGR